MTERILVAVAWPYANGPLHLGHVAGCYLSADIFARYHRLRGNRVLMVSGSDTHGTPITIRADQEGVTPAEVVERYHALFLESWEKLGISFDLFTHTNTANHEAVTHDIFKTLLERTTSTPTINCWPIARSAPAFFPTATWRASVPTAPTPAPAATSATPAAGRWTRATWWSRGAP